MGRTPPAPAKVSSSISKFSTKARCFPQRNEDGSYHIFSDIEAAKIYMVEGSFPP